MFCNFTERLFERSEDLFVTFDVRCHHLGLTFDKFFDGGEIGTCMELDVFELTCGELVFCFFELDLGFFDLAFASGSHVVHFVTVVFDGLVCLVTVLTGGFKFGLEVGDEAFTGGAGPNAGDDYKDRYKATDVTNSTKKVEKSFHYTLDQFASAATLACVFISSSSPSNR
jgi:hypothetical protein